MSPWSSKFKERILQLRLAIKDPETGEIILGNLGEIHDHVIARMNDRRVEKGFDKIPHQEAFKKGREYIKKSNNEFMLAEDAIEWASVTGHDNEQWWGESIKLRWMQVDMGGKNYYKKII